MHQTSETTTMQGSQQLTKPYNLMSEDVMLLLRHEYCSHANVRAWLAATDFDDEPASPQVQRASCNMVFVNALSILRFPLRKSSASSRASQRPGTSIGAWPRAPPHNTIIRLALNVSISFEWTLHHENKNWLRLSQRDASYHSRGCVTGQPACALSHKLVVLAPFPKRWCVFHSVFYASSHSPSFLYHVPPFDLSLFRLFSCFVVSVSRLPISRSFLVNTCRFLFRVVFCRTLAHIPSLRTCLGIPAYHPGKLFVFPT